MKIFKAIIALLSVAAITVTAAFIASPKLRFIAKTEIMSIFSSNQGLTEASSSKQNYKEVKLKELQYAENCVFNQSLLLVNAAHPLDADFEPKLERYEDTQAYLNRCALNSFIELREYITKKFDTRLLIMSSFRSKEEQLEIYKEDKDGVAAKVGESEHETGLGIDVYIKQFAGMGFINSEVGRFVNENCSDFGFIIRYPLGKDDITGFSYEPWHIRYVGLPHSKIISEKTLTLEEYFESLEIDRFYSYGDYIISRQDGDTLTVPSEYESLTISSDNMGDMF